MTPDQIVEALVTAWNEVGPAGPALFADDAAAILAHPAMADLVRLAEDATNLALQVAALRQVLAAAHSAIHSGERCGSMHAALAAALEQNDG